MKILVCIKQVPATNIVDIDVKTDTIKRCGFPSGEHVIGYIKKTYIEKQLGQTKLDLMRGIKKVFDPNCILNPNKVFSL